MDKDLQNIEDLFRSALENNEEIPSARLWYAVDQRLDKETVVTIKKKYKTLKRFSLLLLLLLIGFSIYELNIRYGSSGITKTNNPGKVNITDKDEDNKKKTDKNSDRPKEQIDSKNIPATTLNTITENSNPDNNKQVQNNDPSDKVKQNQNEFPVAIESSVSKIYRDVVETTGEQEIKTEKTFADQQNNITPDVSGQVNHSLSSQKQFDPLHPEKINRFTYDSEAREKLVQSLASLKNTSLMNNMVTTPQQLRKKPVKPSRFSIGGFFSPDIASYHLDDEDIPGQPDNSEDIKRTERHEFSSTSGLLIEYAVNKQWAIQSGLTFSNTNIAVEPRTIYAQINNGDVKYRFNFSSGYAYLVPSFQPVPVLGDSLKVTAITHKLRYIGIPIAVKYSISSGKLKIEAMTGLSTNFLTMGKLETEIQKGPNNEIDILNKIEGLKSIYLSGQAGIGAEYKLTGKVSFILMPTARFALMPINKGSVVKTYPYSFGIASGLKTSF